MMELAPGTAVGIVLDRPALSHSRLANEQLNVSLLLARHLP